MSEKFIDNKRYEICITSPHITHAMLYNIMLAADKHPQLQGIQLYVEQLIGFRWAPNILAISNLLTPTNLNELNNWKDEYPAYPEFLNKLEYDPKLVPVLKEEISFEFENDFSAARMYALYDVIKSLGYNVQLYRTKRHLIKESYQLYEYTEDESGEETKYLSLADNAKRQRIAENLTI